MKNFNVFGNEDFNDILSNTLNADGFITASNFIKSNVGKEEEHKNTKTTIQTTKHTQQKQSQQSTHNKIVKKDSKKNVDFGKFQLTKKVLPAARKWDKPTTNTAHLTIDDGAFGKKITKEKPTLIEIGSDDDFEDDNKAAHNKIVKKDSKKNVDFEKFQLTKKVLPAAKKWDKPTTSTAHLTIDDDAFGKKNTKEKPTFIEIGSDDDFEDDNKAVHNTIVKKESKKNVDFGKFQFTKKVLPAAKRLDKATTSTAHVTIDDGAFGKKKPADRPTFIEVGSDDVFEDENKTAHEMLKATSPCLWDPKRKLDFGKFKHTRKVLPAANKLDKATTSTANLTISDEFEEVSNKGKPNTGVEETFIDEFDKHLQRKQILRIIFSKMEQTLPI